MEETYEMPLDNLLHELEERGIDTSKLNLIEEDWLQIMKEVILDESILNIDEWLPQETIDQTVKLIRHLEKQSRNKYDTSTTYGWIHW